jgi:choline dehydrogenase
MRYDFIVVGAGSSGCALVGRLAAAIPLASILLLEAGTDGRNDGTVLTPSMWPGTLFGPFDYAYKTIPQQHLDQRWVSYPRGKGLGGSSLINALIYSRGFKEDWDSMPEGKSNNFIVKPDFKPIISTARISFYPRLAGRGYPTYF